MQIHFSYCNLTKEQCNPRLEEYANEKKLKDLTRLLKERDFALASLDIHIV